MKKEVTTKLSRRKFVGAAAAVAPMIVPSHCVGRSASKLPPSERLNLAGIGVGAMGGNYLWEMRSESITALCDVDDAFAAKTYAKFPRTKRYRDFRELLQDDAIDAVAIGTPDHTHAVICMAAIKAGKHVYCAKPLTRTIHESRTITSAAEKAGIATQMSIQMNASREHRILAEWIAAGAIGTPREVHVWSTRPIWPQGIGRPKETPAVPKTLDWDLWLGPAPKRPYHPAYHPFKWRGWWDFGAGALGDMGCHGFDPVYRALNLTAPTSVRAITTPVNAETAPNSAIVEYQYPAIEGRPAIKLVWYDGGLTPPRPPELADNRRMSDNNGGMLFVGDDGKILANALGGSPRLIPEQAMAAFKRPPKSIPRSIGHYEEFIAACKGGPRPGAHFGYGGPLTEAVLLGNVAIRTGRELHWDHAAMRVTNVPEANRFIQEPYHNGWTLD